LRKAGGCRQERYGRENICALVSINRENGRTSWDNAASSLSKGAGIQAANTLSVSGYGELKEIMENDDKFIEAYWCGKREFEDKIQEETKATIAVIPFDGNPAEPGKCLYSGEESTMRVIFAKSY